MAAGIANLTSCQGLPQIAGYFEATSAMREAVAEVLQNREKSDDDDSSKSVDDARKEQRMSIFRALVTVRPNGITDRSVEPKVRLQGYGYNPFCSHSSRCLAVLV